MEYEFNILYYINIYKKWGKLIVILMAISMFLTVIVSLLMPVSYISKVALISTDTSSQNASSIGKILGMPSFALGNSSNDIIISILNSNRMASDIKKFLEFNKQTKFKYTISTIPVTAGIAIYLKGNDPEYTEKVANFAVQNMDKINAELNITPAKPMVKVLDPAMYGERQSRQTPRKMLVSGMWVFLVMSLYIFLSDYFKKLKVS